jgi:regulator of nucleoside diphosphate kinase
VKTAATIIGMDDMDRLTQLTRALRNPQFRDQQQLDLLDEVLQNASVIASEHVPTDVIRMNSRFRVLDLDNGRRARYTLVLPENADISNGRLSILAPLGAAVLGRRREEVVEAKVPGGTRRLKIEYALYRPTSRTRSIRSRQRIWPSQDLEVGTHAAPVAA